MGIIGKIGKVTLKADFGYHPLCQPSAVLTKLTRYAQNNRTLGNLFSTVPDVDAVIETDTGGSGAHCNYSKRCLSVDAMLGHQEVADSIIFELLNWSKGDYNRENRLALHRGQLTLRQAGTNIATSEAQVTHEHAQIMYELKTSGEKLSGFANRNIAAVGDSNLNVFTNAMLRSPHDEHAPAQTVVRLKSPEMYMWELLRYETFASVVKGATAKEEKEEQDWCRFCATQAQTASGDEQSQDEPSSDFWAVLYYRCLVMFDEMLLLLDEDYRFSRDMRQLAAAKQLTMGFLNRMTTAMEMWMWDEHPQVAFRDGLAKSLKQAQLVNRDLAPKPRKTKFTISGVVRAQDQQVVKSAKLTLGKSVMYSGFNGSFSFPNVVPGDYTIVATSSKLKRPITKHITVVDRDIDNIVIQEEG